MKTTTREKQAISIDEQIFIAHELEIKLLMIQNALRDLKNKTNTIYDKYDFTKDMLNTIGVFYDGVDALINNIDDTLHDSEIASYKTSEEQFLDEENSFFERGYHDNKREIYNANKL